MSEIDIILNDLIDGTIEKYSTYKWNEFDVLMTYLTLEEIDFDYDMDSTEKGVLITLWLE